MSDETLEINGWTIYAHPLFLDQLEAMVGAVEKARKKDPQGYKKKRGTKLLAAVLKVAFEDVLSDSTRDTYRQGGTLGDAYKHWFRAKFLQQFRLFFRYQQSADAKVIVLAGSTRRCALMRAQTMPTRCFAGCSIAAIRPTAGRPARRGERRFGEATARSRHSSDIALARPVRWGLGGLAGGAEQLAPARRRISSQSSACAGRSDSDVLRVGTF